MIKQKTLFKDDCCFVQKGTEYIMSGSFTAVIVNQPAYETINEKI